MNIEELKRLFSIIIYDYQQGEFGLDLSGSFYINFTQTVREFNPPRYIFLGGMGVTEVEHKVLIRGIIKNYTMMFDVLYDGTFLANIIEVPLNAAKTSDFPKLFIDAVKRYFEIE